MFWRIVYWFALPVLGLLTVLLLYRGVHRQFPYFFCYLAMAELVGVIRLWFYNPTAWTYYYIYWTTDVLIAVFAFLATYEVFIKRLFPRFHTISLYRYLFPVAGLAITLIAAPAALQARKASGLLVAVHVLDVMRVTVLLFFVGLMVFMGRRWTRYELGITMGLILQACAVLISSGNWARSPLTLNVLRRLPVLAYDITCIIWLVTFLRPEKPTVGPTGPVRREVLEQAREWERTLKDSLSGKKREP